MNHSEIFTNLLTSNIKLELGMLYGIQIVINYIQAETLQTENDNSNNYN